MFIKDFSDMTLSPYNFYSFYRMRLKLGGQLDYEVVQHILFRGYRITVHQSLIVITVLRLFTYDLFPLVLQFSSDWVETWCTVRP